MKILGLDPGTARVGFAVIEKTGNAFVALDYGVITTAAGLPRAERLRQIAADLRELLALHTPDRAGVEELFFVQNVTTGIAVAEARGVLLAALAEAGVEICERTPNSIKRTVTGHGHATKKQMQEMVCRIFQLAAAPRIDDAADALAVAYAVA